MRAKDRLAVLDLVAEGIRDDDTFTQRFELLGCPDALDELETRGLISPEATRHGCGIFLLTEKGRALRGALRARS